MGMHMNFQSISATGVTVNSGAASARVALPVNAAGALPKYVRVQSNLTAHIRFGDATVVAATTDFYLSPNNGEVFAVGGATNMAYIQDAATAKIVVTPLEG